VKKILSILVIALLAVGLFAGCGSSKSSGNYKDGIYEEKSQPDKDGNYATIRLTIEAGIISRTEWKEFTADGKEKDIEYGKKSGNPDDYNKAQYAASASRSYGSILQSVHDPEKVDVISGATESNKVFKDLANKALNNAKK
jgi:major membrane immunogen (membrane-anchored lipoprotein)